MSYATPLFWVGLMLIVVFSLKLGWLPTSGMVTVAAFHEGGARVLDIARHLVLPALTLSLFYMALYMRLMRASMLEQAGMDYVTTARAKGLGETRITLSHVLRNAVLPVVTMAGVQVGSLLGGSIVVESVFAWPGLGLLASSRSSPVTSTFCWGSSSCPRAWSSRSIWSSTSSTRCSIRGSTYEALRGADSRAAAPGSSALAILAVVVAVAAFAPVIFPGSPFRQVDRPFAPPFGRHLLGTDVLGRDVAAGIAHGARTSLTIGVLATSAAVLVGTVDGGLAGYYGGRIDDLLMRTTEFFQTIPTFLFAILLVAILAPSVWSIAFAIAVVNWPTVARLVRGEFLAMRGREFVQAALSRHDRRPRDLPPHPAELPVAHHRHRVADRGHRDPDRVRAVISGAGRSQRDELGVHDRRRADISAERVVAVHDPGRRDPAHRARINLVGEGLNDALNPRLRR